MTTGHPGAPVRRPAAKTSAIATPGIIVTLTLVGASRPVIAVASFVVGSLPFLASLIDERDGIRGFARWVWRGSDSQ